LDSPRHDLRIREWTGLNNGSEFLSWQALRCGSASVSYHFVIAVWRAKKARCVPMKDWEIIADNLNKAGFILGWVSALDLAGRTIRIIDAHGYGKRFIVRADEMLTAFVELQTAIHEFAVSLIV
jgi:hypothetical protein